MLGYMDWIPYLYYINNERYEIQPTFPILQIEFKSSGVSIKHRAFFPKYHW